MRRVRYSVAMSLDGYIAGPNGEHEWILMDPDIDFGAILDDFDTVLLGRKSFETMTQGGKAGPVFGLPTYVFSNTLDPADYSSVTVWGDGWEDDLGALVEEPGKDIWLFGGGLLFQSLLEAGLVHGVSVAVIPVLVGGGIPLLPPPAELCTLTLERHQVYEKTGTVILDYGIASPGG